jgi:Erv1 / Alr family
MENEKKLFQLISDLATEIISKQNAGLRGQDLLSQQSKIQMKNLSEYLFKTKLYITNEFTLKILGLISPILNYYKPKMHEIELLDYKPIELGKSLFNILWLMTFVLQIRTRQRLETLYNLNSESASNLQLLTQDIERIVATASKGFKCVQFILSGKSQTISENMITNPGSNGESLVDFLAEYEISLVREEAVKDLYELFYFYNVEPVFWGPKFWVPIHFITEAISKMKNEQHSDLWKAFVLEMGVLLPCVFCQSHWNEIVGEYSNDIKSCEDTELPNLLFKLHNAVRKLMSKPPYAADIFHTDRLQFDGLIRSFKHFT